MKTIRWVLEPAHSEIQFTVRHMMISKVTGSIQKFNAEMETEGDDLTTAKATFTAEAASVNTRNEQRDTHLRSADFFDADNHPLIAFDSGSLEFIADDRYLLHGNLTIRGITRPVILHVQYGGKIKDQDGKMRAGFMVDGTVNRQDFGMRWNALTDKGGVVVSDEVNIAANMEFIMCEEKGATLEQMHEPIAVAA